MDKTSLNLISIILGGVGLFIVLTDYSVPELKSTFFGSNPYAIKRDAIATTMTWIFTSVTMLGLVIQVLMAICNLEERRHSTQFYSCLFVIFLAATVALAVGLTKIGDRVARHSWLPEIVANQREVYEIAKYTVEHDGVRKDQLAAGAALSAEDKAANLKTAASYIEQIEKLLDIEPSQQDLAVRLDEIKPYFDGKQQHRS